MIEQMSLLVSKSARYERALALYRDTSREAWTAFKAHLSETDRLIVQEIRTSGGATCDAVEYYTGLKHQTVSAQIRHLYEAGILVDSGELGRTRSGRNAVIWRVTPPREALR